MAKYDGKYLCHNCMHKTSSSRIMQSACTMGKPKYTLEKALNRIYSVKTYAGKNHISSMIGVSNVLAGRKVKLILVEEKRREPRRRRIKR